jgi:hypothetical protein
MPSRHSIAVLATNAAVALIATGVTWGLVHLAAVEKVRAPIPAPVRQVAAIQQVQPEAPLRRARFAFVAEDRQAEALAAVAGPEATEAAEPPPETGAEPGLRASVPLETGSISPWSTEVAAAVVSPPPAPPRRTSVLPWLLEPKARSKRAGRGKPHTLASRLAEIGPEARERLVQKFTTAGAIWPPSEIVLIAVKDEKVLELFARAGTSDPWKRVHRYRVLAASGGPGPKLLQGDRQVPEGVYAISFLNPNSAYHVSLRVNYPNSFDRKMAAKDGRKQLGGDIMIHGKNLSAGCLAMGDAAAEELFVLAAQTGLAHVKLIIAPTDFRQNEVPAAKPGQPAWLSDLYTEVATAMAPYKVERSSNGLLSFFMK